MPGIAVERTGPVSAAKDYRPTPHGAEHATPSERALACPGESRPSQIGTSVPTTNGELGSLRCGAATLPRYCITELA